MNQEITFTLDEPSACVWIDFIHSGRAFDPIFRYRLNCADRSTMFIRANYWFYREYPQVTQKERTDFRTKWDRFYEANKEKIEGLASELGIKKHVQLSRLLSDIKCVLILNNTAEDNPPAFQISKMGNIQTQAKMDDRIRRCIDGQLRRRQDRVKLRELAMKWDSDKKSKPTCLTLND
jgi:hypothetical protein